MSERLKKSLSEFVDTLVDSEISQVGTSLKEMKRELQDEIADLRKELRLFKDSYKQDRKQLEALFADVHKNVHSANDHKQRIGSLEERQKHVTDGIEDMIGKVATIVEDHHDTVEGQIGDLAQRVKHNEKILFVTRGDHEALTMILKKFSSGLSLMNEEIQQPLEQEDKTEHTSSIVTASAKNLVEKHHETLTVPIIEEPREEKTSENPTLEEVLTQPSETGQVEEETHSVAPSEESFTLAPSDTAEMENLDSMFIV